MYIYNVVWPSDVSVRRSLGGRFLSKKKVPCVPKITGIMLMMMMTRRSSSGLTTMVMMMRNRCKARCRPVEVMVSGDFHFSTLFHDKKNSQEVSADNGVTNLFYKTLPNKGFDNLQNI